MRKRVRGYTGTDQILCFVQESYREFSSVQQVIAEIQIKQQQKFIHTTERYNFWLSVLESQKTN